MDVKLPSVAPPHSGLPPTRERLLFIDNLRWVMIALVVSMHAAVTYSHLGSWYFMEDPKPGMAEMVVFATYQTFLQAFFMGLLFFVAGYFVPEALERKGWRHFLIDRSVRLGLPSLLYMLVIHPFTVYWLLRNFADHARPSLVEAYPAYVYSGRILSGSGPMWFALALLFFSLIYVCVWNFYGLQGRSKPPPGLPGNRQVVALILLMGLCTFLVRIVQPIGSNVFNMQLCYFSQYVLLFTAGTYARKGNWLVHLPFAFGRFWLRLALCLGTFLWGAFAFALLKTHSEALVSGGLTWQSAVMSFWESFFCIGLCLGLLVIFRERFNCQSRLTRWLSDNAFSVYVLHPPLLIAVTLCFQGFAAPKLLKFVCATFAGLIASYLASSLLFRRIPLLKRIL
jgi:glucans biosynthesis protein C